MSIASSHTVRGISVAGFAAALLFAPMAVGHAPAAPAGPAAKCASCGHNLIKNAGAEAGKGTTADLKVPVPHWTVNGNFTAAAYRWSSGDLSKTSPGPKNRGKNYFYGGPAGIRHTTGTQVIALAKSGISGGKITYELSGWLGGFSSQTDNAVLTATFENAQGKALKTARIGPVTPNQRDDTSELLKRSTSGKVPSKSTQVTVVLTLTRHDVSDDDGIADDLSLILS